MAKSTVDNTKNNRLLGIILLAVLVIMNALAISTHHFPATILQMLIIAAVLGFAYLNFTAKPEVDNWVGVVGWLVVVATVIIYVIPVSKHTV